MQAVALVDAIPKTPWDLPHCSLKRQGHASPLKLKGPGCLLGFAWSQSSPHKPFCRFEWRRPH